ncbi:hypothetical protein ZIOFF_043853 [Zingiber officinale]|uniref:Mitochondrial inner membrane protease ATP23 n=1 Tax=Zingiber officinale TaxID=94328 RepID=A0A8J5FW35_ZINOF|nr:hypothetical protein ZIOFF_043853 [Zingiber officinale]
MEKKNLSGLMAEAAPDPGSGAAAGAPIPDAGTGVETSIRGSGMPFRECVDRINKSLDHPKVRFLREHMLKAGCPVWVQLLMPLNCNSEGLSYAGGYVRGKGIRANHLSGDCHYKRELLRGYTKLRGHEQECVKRRALKSLQLNPNCSGAAAKDAIEAVWDICYNDTYPFERAP